MSFCSKCGCEVPDDANYCSACGNTLMHTGIETTHNSEQSSTSSKPTAKLFLLMLFVFFIVVGAVILIIIIAPWKKISFSDNTDEIRKASESVVLLQCYDKNGELYCSGSAFAAFEEGIFVTNYHVIEQEVYRIVACTEDNTMFEINSVLAADSKRDIAILKTDSKTNIAPLMIGSSSNLEKGEKVVTIGSPLGFLNTVSTGVFSGYIENDTIHQLQFSASISHGSSGGALFNNQGKVIGITCGSYEDGQNLNVAVPIQYVSDLMNTPASPLTIEQFYGTFDHHTNDTGPAEVDGTVMTHAEFMAADLDSAVCVETYVQDTQSWWDNQITVYAQSEDGAYLIYNMECSQENAAKLVPGAKIRVTGYKAEWSGEVEIMDGSFELLEGSYIAEAADLTDLLGTDTMLEHQNEKASFTGLTVEAIAYKNDEPGDDIYLTLSKDGVSYNFCVEVYLTGTDSDVYTTVGTLNVGDTVDVECFVYWYEGMNPHITSIVVK